MTTQPKWLQRALAELGQSEIAGPRHNARIVGYARAIGASADWIVDDETPWCATFVGAMLEATGIASSRSARAKSYLEWGRPRADGESIVGAICVFNRGRDPAAGHVGFALSETADAVQLVGGNQSNTVSVVDYLKADLVAVRFPTGWQVPSPAARLRAPHAAPPAAPSRPAAHTSTPGIGAGSALPAPAARHRESWTVTQLYVAMGGVLDLVTGLISGALGWLADGAAHFAELQPVTAMLAKAGLAPEPVVGGLVLGCLTLALHRTIFRNVRRDGAPGGEEGG